MKFIATMTLLGLFLISRPNVAQSRSEGTRAEWSKTIADEIYRIEARWPNKVGVFVKDLSTGKTYSHRGDETWYVASGVKLPIAMETLSQIDRGLLSLESKIEITENDYVDGAGPTNSLKPGSKVTVRWLIEQMLIHSDNTATDLLIRRVGLENVNAGVRKLVPQGFEPITTLADVRRLALSNYHPRASALSNPQIRLVRASSGTERAGSLAKLLGVARGEMKSRNEDEAFDGYYSKKLNSATLVGYGALLETMALRPPLQSPTREFLMSTLQRVQTGKDRVGAGFPSSVAFAHKTGTQRSRVCDFGLAWDRKRPERKIAVATCARGIRSLRVAESALKLVGQAVARSGVFAEN